MNKRIYANDFAARREILFLHCIAHRGLPNKKSDAYLLEYCGSFYLIDGGLPRASEVQEYLHGIRRALLSDHAELLSDPSCKLRINWIISHFHADHVGLGIDRLLSDPYLEVGEIYLPPDSAVDARYAVDGMDGDEKLRPSFFEALSRIEEPAYTIREIPFGKENRFSVSVGGDSLREVILTFLPPVEDLGAGWYLDYLYDSYTDGGSAPHRIPVSAVNNASVWVLVTFGEHRMLFTGDTMKREKHFYSEGLDLMMEAYRDEIGSVDVLKYVHHGFARRHALPAMMSLSPRLLLVSKSDSPIGELVSQKYPNAEAEVLNVADRSLLVTCGYDGGRRLPLSYKWLGEE